MGGSTYSLSNRSFRAKDLGYFEKGRDEIFTQSKEKKIHESMSPKGVSIRESRDSEAHPGAIPIQLYLDVTGSMGHIPHDLIKEGLPTLMGTLIQNGVPDAALLFAAVGDHECDRHPLQIGQFESGDAELDMWLTRSYLEGGGGGNYGESYLLAWYFAGHHVKTDAFDKRKKKGFVFTVGDEPCLKNLPVSAIKGIMGETAMGQSNFTREELLAKAQEQNHVYHIHINHGSRSSEDWRQLLGKNLIEIGDYKSLPRVISDIILSHETGSVKATVKKEESGTSTEEEVIL